MAQQQLVQRLGKARGLVAQAGQVADKARVGKAAQVQQLAQVWAREAVDVALAAAVVVHAQAAVEAVLDGQTDHEATAGAQGPADLAQEQQRRMDVL